MDFLKDIQFKTVDIESRTSYSLGKVNEDAHIPQRFAESRLGEYGSKIEDEVKDFCLKESNDGVMLISGNVGVGKTTLLCGALHERDISGLSCGEFLSCRRLCAKIRTSRSFSAKISEDELYELYTTIPFLCIDELGKSEDSVMERQFICTVLAGRYDNMLPTMIATNMSASQIKEFILGDSGNGADILDRMSSSMTFRSIDGKSFRIK